MKTTGMASLVMGIGLAFSCTQRAEELTLGVAKTHGNLRLVPIRANDVFLRHHRAFGPYLSLRDAVAAGKVKVTEYDADTTDAEASPQVNRLFIENHSGDTVLILNGETVNGGKQDRMIAADVMVPPDGRKLDLSVFCIEHGRWTEPGSFEVAELSLPPAHLRPGKEVPTQDEVWEDIKVNLDVAVVDSETGALNDIKLGNRFQSDVDGYEAALTGAFQQDAHVVGIIAVVGDRVLGYDVFGYNALFIRHFPNLLHSYSAEAVLMEYSDNLDAGTVSPESLWPSALREMKDSGFLGAGNKPGKGGHFAGRVATK
jgi:hypothetical protein